MLNAFLGGWVPRDDGCCTLFQVGGSPDGGKGTVTYLPWERNATRPRRVAFLSRVGIPIGYAVTVPPTSPGAPTYLVKSTTLVVRGHPPTYRNVRRGAGNQRKYSGNQVK
jgi:hypothetical protein